MAGVALLVATLVACVLLLLLVHLELRSAEPVVYEGDAAAGSVESTYGSVEGTYAVGRRLAPPSPLSPAAVVEPICQVTFGRAVCMKGGTTVPCPPKVDLVRHDTEALATGAWVLAPTYTYFLDRGLSGALTQLFAGASVIELGAGKGCYAAELRRAPPQRAGGSRIGVRAFDGAPNVANLTGGLVQRADLTLAMGATLPAEWVLCLETAEHIPRAHEATLLANLHRLNTVGVVLSWSNNAGGNGHVNLRTNEWVARRFAQTGYEHDLDAEAKLRKAVSDIHWFRDTVMVMRRKTR